MLDINEVEKSTNDLLLDVCKNQRKTIKSLKTICITVIVCFSLIICTMVAGFFYYESQFDIVDSTTTQETTTTELKTSGENANINNVSNGDMYNDNAIHNEK
jgi:hypothetical protein